MGGPIEATVTPFGGAAIPDFWCSQAPSTSALAEKTQCMDFGDTVVQGA